jgi:hypothetical protein
MLAFSFSPFEDKPNLVITRGYNTWISKGIMNKTLRLLLACSGLNNGIQLYNFLAGIGYNLLLFILEKNWIG